jgi:Ca2+-binding EF-hand superfamily protein
MNISENDNNNENKLKFSSDESNEKDKSIEEENINKIENNFENKNEEEEEQKTINNSDIKNVEEEEQKNINIFENKNEEEEEQKTINNSDIKNVEEEEQKTINNYDSIEIENNNKSIQNENFEDSKLSASKQSNKEIIKNIEEELNKSENQSNKEIIKNIEEELNKSDNKSENQKHSKEKENSINNNISIDKNKSNKTSENNFSRNSISNISYIERKKISIFNEKEDYHKKAELYYNSLSQEEKKKLSNIVTYIKGQNHQLNEEELKEIFKKLDVNERDKINFEDLKNFLGVLRTNVNNYYINEIIKEYGNDKKEITQKMFIKKMNENIKGKYKKDDITELREIFQLFDTNHDNKISYEDIKNVMNALGETTFNDDMCKEMIRHLKLKANVNNIAINKDNCYLNYNDFIEIVKGESEQ